jgi:hypothetical protein
MDGWRLQASYLKEARALGSDVSLAKLSARARHYLRLSGGAQTLAVQAGAGTTFGHRRFERSYAIGGFPSGSLLDIVDTRPALLRGYPTRAFQGRRFANVNVEYRFALGHPQRGLWTIPVFVRHLHAAVFADAAHAWSGAFQMAEVKTSVGLALGVDLHLGHGLPLTANLGLARGLADAGETQVYFQAGLAF